jgi:GNAT superfamily N-acetyltransferase
MSYSIREATATDLPALSAIERAAAEMFRHSQHPQLADFPLACAHLQSAEGVWVVVDGQQRPVGFAIVCRVGRALHLQELDVHPQHARRGLGGRLIEAIADRARSQGVPELTLSTCADIPWNAPYYARLGFRTLAVTELTAELLEVRRAETAAGLPMQHRVCMQRTL